ncbi:MAG TPA: NHLP leader peptide family RiPP precursor [Gemmatimonadaceae bacterium]
MPTIQEMYIGKRIEREQQVLSKVLGDPATRAALRERPKATLESIYGVQFPEGTDIRVLEEQVGSHYVVLPPEGLGAGGGELSDSQLETVAGGWFIQLIATSICFGSGDPGDTSVPDIPVVPV